MASRCAHRSDVRLVSIVDEIWRGQASRCRKGDAEAIRWRWESGGYSMPHYKPWLGKPTTANCDFPRYSAESHYICNIIAPSGLLSVTESVVLPPLPKGRSNARSPHIQSP
jgi:hypothetical protein